MSRSNVLGFPRSAAATPADVAECVLRLLEVAQSHPPQDWHERWKPVNRAAGVVCGAALVAAGDDFATRVLGYAIVGWTGEPVILEGLRKRVQETLADMTREEA